MNGVPVETVHESLTNVTNPRGDRYRLLPVSADSLTYVANTFSVLLNRPLLATGIQLFETSLADALKPLLGQSLSQRFCFRVVGQCDIAFLTL